MTSSRPVLRVRGLTKRFGSGCAHCAPATPDVLRKNDCPHCGSVYALQDVSFDVHEGEVLGIVGESGSGKSTILNCLYFDAEPTRGEAYLRAYEEGRVNLWSVSGPQRRWVRNHLLGKVYQNPMLGLNMDFSSVANIAEKMIAADDRNVGRMEARARTLLEHTRIPAHRMKSSPRQFSGGMQQRVQIAKALSNEPPILFLDEVTTGLDLSVQARVLDLIKQIRRDVDVAMILVSHDLAVIRMLADRTVVMLDGRMVESGLTDQIMEDPQHPYTQELVYSLL